MRQKYKGKDIIDRLHHTVIRYKSHPYLCTVDSSGIINLHDLTNGNLCHKVDAEDEELDISSINLGWVNIADPDFRLAVYLKREPQRRYKQGIQFEVLTQRVLRDGISTVRADKLSCRGFVDAVLGVYPSFTQGMEYITKNGWHSVALSRDVAIKLEADLLKVYLKDDEVGYMKLGKSQVIVPQSEMSWYHVFLLENIKHWTVVEGGK